MIADLKPYPAMEDSGVEWMSSIPDQWRFKRTKFLFREKDHRAGDEGGVLLSLTRSRGLLPQTEASKRIASVEDLSNYRVCRPGDLVMNRMQAWSGMFAVSSCDGVVSPDYSVFEATVPSEVKFFEHLFKTPLLVAQFALRSKGIGSGFNRLYADDFGDVSVPVPPLPEQAAIVRFLDHADRRIRRYIRAKQKLITLLEEQKQALIHQAVTGQIDVRTGQPYPAYKPSRVEWLEDVPEHWEVRRLKSKLRPVDRRSSSGTETLLSLRRDFGVVVYAEHFSRPPQGVTLVGYKLVEAGQLVVNRLQANNGLLFCSRLSGVVSPDYSVFAARSPVDMEYLGNLLRTVTYKTHFRRESTGLGTGSAGFLRLYDDRLLETPVALPPLEEQSTLLVSLSEITASLCRAIGRQHVGIALLREYSTRLIADVVTGKFDVREAAERLPEVDPLADEFDALTTQATETGVMELEDATELPEEFAMENEVII